jgi:ubiquinol-cytochrome c reductase cytochrome b subunit
MTRRLVRWLDDRLGAASFLRKAMDKAFPDHWSFMLGEVALYSYIALVLSGIFLAFFYTASDAAVVYHGPYKPLDGVRMSEAYQSILYLSFQVRSGLVIRQFHHWAAVVFIAAICVHVTRIFFSGAFRRPRELNWVVGVTLFLLAIVIGYTGYSLPDDLLSGTGIRIAYSIALSIPVIGTWFAYLFFGGAYPGTLTLQRFLIIHVMLFQALILGLIGAHLFFIWHQKHTQYRGPGRTEHNVIGSPLWPRYTVKSIGLAMLIFAVLWLLGGLVQINPVWLYGPYEPYVVSAPAQPDWYLGWVEGALRLWPNWELRIFGHLFPVQLWPGAVFPGAAFLIMYLWPWIEKVVTRDTRPHNLLDRARDNPGRSAVGAWAIAFSVILTLAGSNDVLAKFFDIPVELITVALRVVVGVLPVLVGIATYFTCRELRQRELEPERPRVRTVLTIGPGGGYEEAEDEVPVHGGGSAR